MSVMEDVDVLLGLELSMDEVKACEHDFHEQDTENHSGDAQWYIQLKPSCKCLYIIGAVCDAYRDFLREIVANNKFVFCGACKSGIWIKMVVDERI